MLAIWRYCPHEHSLNVLRYFERGAKEAMKYEGREFVEFFRRILDFPRRGLLNAQEPNFMEVTNYAVAVAAGAKVYLPPETYLTLRSPAGAPTTNNSHTQITRAGAYSNPKLRRGRITSTYTTRRGSEPSLSAGSRADESVLKRNAFTPKQLGRKPNQQTVAQNITRWTIHRPEH